MLLNVLSISTLLMFPLTCAYTAENISESLPEPLTLEFALSFIDQQHPDLRYVDADLRSARSNLQQILSNNDLTVSINAEARWIEPSAIAINQLTEGHRLVFMVDKTLYNFGRSHVEIDAATEQVLSQNLQYFNAQQRQHLNIMKRYFDVVLADLQFYRYNEEMAVSYIRFDRIKIREKLGQNTEIDVVAREVEYQRVRGLRTLSQNQQRVTRALLAQALNKPNNLSTTVTKPELDVVSRKLPEIEKLQKTVNEHNLVLAALRAKFSAAKKYIKLAYAIDNPVLTGKFEAFNYAREINTSNKWQANITLNIPLWNGGREDAAVAKAKAAMYKIEAQLEKQKLLVQQQVLELWLSIKTLKIKHDEVLAAMNFAELSLDKNRALYELEVKSDLGYSMVRFSEAERNVVQTNFNIALAWAQLDALNGRLRKKH